MAQRLTGFGRPELLQMLVTYLFRAEAQGGLQRLRLAFRKTGPFHGQEGFFLRHQKEGVWIPVSLTVTRLHAEPRTLGLVTVRDVSDSRRAQEALLKSCVEQRDAEPLLRNLIAMRARTSGDQTTQTQATQVVAHLSLGHGVRGPAQQRSPVFTQVAIGKAVRQQTKNQQRAEQHEREHSQGTGIRRRS